MVLLPPIPGETPIDDLSGLKVKGIRTRRELNHLEAQNILKATEKYFLGRLTSRKAPFDYTWVLRLHGEMFGEVWAWAGTLRTHPTNIGVPPRQIEQLLADLLLRLPFWKDEPWFTQAAMLHHEAVRIHPFMNGNGRWSRMLTNIWLRRNGQPHTLWPEETVGAESEVRKAYLSAVKTADEGEYGPLTELHEQFTPKKKTRDDGKKTKRRDSSR
jgi:Fic-DOC domain mobile mystery protein B